MKKHIFALFIIISIIFASCSNEIKDSPENGGVGSWGTLFVQNEISRWIDLQIWEETASVDFAEDGSTIKVTGIKDWFGVALVRNNEDRYFNLRNADYLTFEAKGNVPLERAKVYMTGLGSIGNDKALSEYLVGENTYSEETSAKFEIDISSLSNDAKERISTILVIFADNSDAAVELPQYQAGQWIEISSVDFLDNNKNHVDIDFEAIKYNDGTFSDIFVNSSIDNYSLQAWEGTCTLEVRDSGLRIYSNGETWFGGAIVTQDGEYADLSGVKRLTFSVRGNMNAEDVKVGVKFTGYDPGVSLSSLDPNKELNEETFESYEIDITENLTDLQTSMVSMLFYFSQAESYSGPGYWIEFKDIDFKDASGNSIRIKSYEDDAEIGDFTNLFTDIEEGTDLDIQIWKDSEGNADMSMTSEGLRVIPTGAWAGGGIVNPLANQGETNYDLFDFSNVSKMSFKIKGTTRADSLKIYLQRNEHMDTDTGSLYPSYSTPEGTLADNGCTEIKEDEWTEVTFSVPDDFDSADYAFTFVTGDDKSGWAGTYFIVKDITYFDANGQSVALSYVD